MEKLKITCSFKLKSFHPYYLNRFVLLSQKEFNKFNSIKIKHSFLPRNYEKFTVLKSPHVDKKARDQFERITYNRLLSFNYISTKNFLQSDLSRLITLLQNCSIGVEVSLRNVQTTL